MRGGGNDETVSTGCGPPSVLHILDVTVTYARDSFVDSPAGPFVLSRGGPDILAPGLQVHFPKLRFIHHLKAE